MQLITSFVFVAALLLLTSCLHSAGGVSTNVHCIRELIAQLETSDTSDTACMELCRIGLHAIPYLIHNGNNTNIYQGRSLYSPISSLYTGKPTVGVVSLYLVECILHGRVGTLSQTQTTAFEICTAAIYTNLIVCRGKHPVLTRRGQSCVYLIPDSKEPHHTAGAITPPEFQHEAVQAYKEWWKKYGNAPMEELRTNDPLEKTSLAWW